MSKVFVGGSRRLARLNGDVRRRLDHIMTRSFTVLVGDANGVDKAVQKHFADRLYNNVVVFCAGNSCRNNIGGWETKNIRPERETKDYRFYMAKDVEMAQEADYGFMIWDGRSAGTLSNILELLERGKSVLLYMGPDKSFVKLRGMEELQRIVMTCPDDAIDKFEKRFKLSSRIQSRGPYQNQMFV